MDWRKNSTRRRGGWRACLLTLGSADILVELIPALRRLQCLQCRHDGSARLRAVDRHLDAAIRVAPRIAIDPRAIL